MALYVPVGTGPTKCMSDADYDKIIKNTKLIFFDDLGFKRNLENRSYFSKVTLQNLVF